MASNYYECTDEWCSVALHDIFSACGDTNRAKFGRKRILCAIGLNDAEGARTAFAAMSEAAQNEPLTRYLMFKASLVDWDTELGCQSIKHLAESVDAARCQEMLYACIREAQQAGDKLCTLAALKAVALSWDPDRSSAACLPSILRGSIRLINLMEKEGRSDKIHDPSELFIEDTCKLFELGKLVKEVEMVEEADSPKLQNELNKTRETRTEILSSQLRSWIGFERMPIISPLASVPRRHGILAT